MRLRPVLAASIVALCLASPTPIRGQVPSSPASDPATPASAPEQLPTEDEILARRDTLRQAIQTAGKATAGGGQTAPAKLAELEKVDRLLALQLAEIRRPGQFVEEELPPPPTDRFGHPPPYSIDELDELLDEHEAVSAALRVAQATLKQADHAVETARSRLDEVESPTGSGRGPDTTPDPGSAHQAAAEQLTLRRLQQRGTRLEVELRRANKEHLVAQIQEVRERLSPVESELSSKLAAIEAEDLRIDEQLDEAREQLRAAETRWTTLQEQVELDAQPDAELLARVEASRLATEEAQLRLEHLSNQRERNLTVAEAWKLRFQILSGNATTEALAGHTEEVADQLDKLEAEEQLAEARLGERQLALGVLRDQQARQTSGGGAGRWLGQQEEHARQIVSLFEDELEDLASAVRLTSRLEDELEARIGQTSLIERLALLWRRLVSIWRYEVTSADGKPITLGKIVTALLLILIGYFISKRMSLRLGGSILPRFGVTRGAAAAFQTLAFYGMLTVFFLWALQLVEIPLTVFTFVGGVLAIGIGFGSQNVMNNFISGLIILAEHPIKVGDLIDIDGVFGQVERIGPRSSRIRAGDNTHIIVPNSAFLEKNVLNWTVSDDVIRTSVDVGVAYGSPVGDVAEGLKRAIAEEQGALEKPEPEILFMDFGDNALAFRAYFWMNVNKPLDRYRLGSKLRFRIDRIFREMDIVIAFPQRDVHLDSTTPLQVRMVGGPSRSTE